MTLQLIEINLSEEFSRKKKKGGTGMPQIKLPPWFGIAIAIIVLAFSGFHIVVKTRQSTSTKLTRQIETLATSNTIAGKLIDDQGRLNERIQALTAWRSNRLTYAKVWQRISQIVPHSIYFTDIKLTKTDSAGDKVDFTLVGRTHTGADIVGFVNKIQTDQILCAMFDKIELDKNIRTEAAETVFTINMTRTINMTSVVLRPRTTSAAGGPTP